MELLFDENEFDAFRQGVLNHAGDSSPPEDNPVAPGNPTRGSRIGFGGATEQIQWRYGDRRRKGTAMTTMSMLGEVRPEHNRAIEDGRVLLHYLRSFRMPVLDVWSACAERGQLDRWFGKVTGGNGNLSIEPFDGPVPGPIAIRVEDCRAPHDLVIHVDGGIVEVHMTQVGVVTNLELIRRHICPADACSVGPRWQYLLDRLTAYLDQRPLPSWADYPELTNEYR